MARQLAQAIPPSASLLTLSPNKPNEDVYLAFGDHFPLNLTNLAIVEKRISANDISSLLRLRPVNLTHSPIYFRGAYAEGYDSRSGTNHAS